MTHLIPVPLPYAFVDHHAVGLAGKGIDGRAVTYGADPVASPSPPLGGIGKEHA
ncbi:hypothetical protein ACWEGS_32370 [Streptomyces sp. NPDC004822]